MSYCARASSRHRPCIRKRCRCSHCSRHREDSPDAPQTGAPASRPRVLAVSCMDGAHGGASAAGTHGDCRHRA
ncbi:hypothetical protein DDJ70_32160, partial [Klebsiella michiganensis]